MAADRQLTQLLNDWRTADDAALLEKIIPAVYDELHRLAGAYMRGQPAEHTLQATALVNEAFLRLRDVKTELEDRGHFIGIVANVMRNVLVDHARAKQTQKRGGGARHVEVDEAAIAGEESSVDVLALEQVLQRLEQRDPRKVRIAELHYFCGATYAETAAALGISEATLHRELKMLKALLSRQLREAD